MFSKFIAFIFLLAGIYLLSIFVMPELSDQYGSKDINTRIRDIKDKSLNFASGSDSAKSIAEKILDASKGATTELKSIIASGSEVKDSILDTSKQFIEEGKQTIETTEQIITEKTEQAKKAAESAQSAYDAVEKAKKDFENLTNFSGSTQVTISGSSR